MTGVRFSAFSNDIEIESDTIRAAAEVGSRNLALLDEKEKLLLDENIVVRPNSAQYTHKLFFKTNQKTRDLSRNAVIGLKTTAALANK